MIVCPHCHQSNDAGQNYCRSCGNPLPQPQRAKSDQPKQPRPYGWASDSSSLHNISIDDLQQPATPPAHPVQPTPPPYQPPTVQQQQFTAFAPPVRQPSVTGYRCPRCGTNAPPKITSRITEGGWIVMIVMLFVCFPLFWIGFLIKEESRVCSVCLTRIG